MKKYANTKVASKKQEKRIAKEMNAKVTVASGALEFQKADVRDDMFLVEAKTTEKEFYPLNIKTWDKISDQALHDGMRIPVMCLDLDDGRFPVAVMSIHDFEVLKGDHLFTEPLKPIMAKTSTRIKPDFMHSCSELDLQHIKEPFYKIQLVHFKAMVKGTTTLVLLDWRDFLTLQGEMKDEQ